METASSSTLQRDYQKKQLRDNIKYNSLTDLHYSRLQGSKLESYDLQGTDIDVSSLCNSNEELSVEEPRLDLFVIHLSGRGTTSVGTSYNTILSLFETLQIPAQFLGILEDNSGVFCALESEIRNRRSSSCQSLAIKIPFAPHVNGAVYFRYDTDSKKTTVVFFFEPYFTSRITALLQECASSSEDGFNPFKLLGLFASECSKLLEGGRRTLDYDLSEAELFTDVALLQSFNRVPIYNRPTMFESFHRMKQKLLNLERAVKFQHKLFGFL